MAMPSDSCRKQQLFGGLARANHPMAKFMWGNSKTLKLSGDPDGVELNRRLRLFWQEYYTSDRMTVVLQSKHTLDELEEWAASAFQEIPSSGSSSPAMSFKECGIPFDRQYFNRMVKVVPVKDIKQVSVFESFEKYFPLSVNFIWISFYHQVCLSWSLPSQLDKYRIKPLNYISWLVGHEGRGSLLAYLRRKYVRY